MWSRVLQPVATFVPRSEDLQGFLAEQAILLPKSCKRHTCASAGDSYHCRASWQIMSRLKIEPQASCSMVLLPLSTDCNMFLTSPNHSCRPAGMCSHRRSIKSPSSHGECTRKVPQQGAIQEGPPGPSQDKARTDCGWSSRPQHAAWLCHGQANDAQPVLAGQTAGRGAHQHRKHQGVQARCRSSHPLVHQPVAAWPSLPGPQLADQTAPPGATSAARVWQ